MYIAISLKSYMMKIKNHNYSVEDYTRIIERCTSRIQLGVVEDYFDDMAEEYTKFARQVIYNRIERKKLTL